MSLSVSLAVSQVRDGRAAAIHKCDVGGASRSRNGRSGTCGCSSIEDGLLTTLEPVIELPSASSDCRTLAS